MKLSWCPLFKCLASAFILVLFFSTVILLNATGANQTRLPFQPGEKLTFKLSWTFFPAGTAVLEVLPIETLQGIEVYHFVLTARSNAFVDAFYKVRDRIDAYTDTEMTHTVLYKKNQHEGSTKRNVVVTFDWEKNQAQYTTDEEKRDPIDILPGTFDPLSIFYRTRLFDLKNQKILEHPVSDGKKCVIGRASIVRKEKLKIAGGILDTYLLEPELKHIGGVFEKSEDAKIQLWVTADSRMIPVKIKSKVAVGSFIGELISAKGLTAK